MQAISRVCFIAYTDRETGRGIEQTRTQLELGTRKSDREKFEMHVILQRARQHSRGRFLTGAALNFVGATLLLSTFAGLPSMAAQRADADALITGSLPPKTTDIPYEIRIEVTSPGKEGIELAGRLSEDGGLITRPINWKLLRTLGEGSQGGKLVHDSTTPVADIALEPGNYRIEAKYGSVSFTKSIKLLESQHLGLTFVFNVGGLRTLSTIGKEPLPGEARVIHKAYAINGINSGQLIAKSDVQGGLIRLGAGKYRLESEIEPGNTVVQTDVTITPGILTTLQLDHQAGMAEVDAPSDVVWTVTSDDREWRASGKGQQVLTLAPGKYTYEGGNKTRTLIIAAGSRTKVRGND